VRAYGHAIRTAITKANAAGVKVRGWAPNQLRHSFATKVRQDHGLEAAQVLLGHARVDVTQVYAARDERLAVEVAALVG
jgi:site-specific recombinase XerD